MRRRAVVEVSGGLGNQLFQLAAAVFLKRSFSRMRLDLRPNASNGFRVNEIEDLASILKVGPHIESSFGYNICAHFFRKFSFIDATLIQEKAEFLPPPPGRLIGTSKYRGYWQSAVSADLIRSDVKTWLNLESEDGIAMHVRRGDYLTPTHIGKHGLLSDDYYLQALSIISKYTKTRRITLFTDSPLHVESLLGELHTAGWTVSLDDSVETSAKSVLSRLASYEFLVGSNSTFSWWAAFAGQTIIAVFPSEWFVDSEFPSGLKTENMQIVQTKLLTKSE